MSSSNFRGETTLATIQKLDQLSSRLHDLFHKAVDLHYEFEYAIVAPERENAGIQLRTLSETIRNDITELREVALALSVTDVAEMYATAGHGRDEAIVKAKEGLAGLSGRLTTIELRVGKWVAEAVYGV